MNHNEHKGRKSSRRDSTVLSLVSFVVIALYSVPAHAELVFFADGRNMSVKAHRIEGTSLVLSLRSGGEIRCDPALVSRFEPDEVPYPEPEPVVSAERGDVRGDVQQAAIEPRPSPELQSDPRYDSMIESASARHGVPATLVRAVIQVESNYESRARSSKGAKGLMQLMPATARQFGVANPYDPASNIEAGIQYLKALLSRLPLDLALAAYNAGEATVQRFRGVPPYAETRSYVDRILKLVGRS
jgi:hypothetical protein